MKILFISLGCDKTLVDSEHMLGMLCENGFSVTDDEREADALCKRHLERWKEELE